MLRVLQFARMQHVMTNSGSAAESNTKHATYGVVMQIDGKMVGLMPVSLKDGVSHITVSHITVSHITGTYSSHKESSPAHRDVGREMLEMLIGDLGGGNAVAEFDISAKSGASTSPDLYIQCGIVLRNSTKERLVLDYGT